MWVMQKFKRVEGNGQIDWMYDHSNTCAVCICVLVEILIYTKLPYAALHIM